MHQSAMLSHVVLVVMVSAAWGQAAPDLETALGSMPQYSEFLDLLKQSGLLAQLKAAPQMTLFAPNNNALGQIDPQLLADVQNDPAFLQSYLEYHAMTDAAWQTSTSANDVVLTSLNGQPIRINVYPLLHTVSAEGINITEPNIQVANGYVQGIGGIMEAPEGDVVDLVNSWNTTSTLATLLATSGLDAVLRADKNLTIFAPTDEAFKNLDPSVLTYLQNNPKVLQEVLLYHVITDTTLYSIGMRHSMVFPTADTAHDPLMLLESGDDIFLNSAELADRDLSATNGVMHTVEQVLIPASVLVKMEDLGLGHVVG